MNIFNRAPVTLTLIALCVISFLGTANFPQNPFALYYPDNPNFQFWQYLTSMFMHGGIAHLLFNMIGLFMFGMALEQLWGGGRFLLFYLLAGIGSGILYNGINEYQFTQLVEQFYAAGYSTQDMQKLLNEGLYMPALNMSEEQVKNLWVLYNVTTVGASGAIYGVLVAFAMCFPNNKLMLIFLPFPIAAKYFVPILLGIELLSGLTGFSIFGDGIAHYAHLSGALIGFILVLLLGRR